jgi:PAS domain-containing protein
LGRLVVLHDVTEYKRIEEQLRVRGAALEAAANGIAIVDRQGQFIWANPAFTRLTGYALPEIIGQTPRLPAGVHGGALPQHVADVSGPGLAGRDGQPPQGWRLILKNRPLLVQGGTARLPYFISRSQDISERKRAKLR